jgi:2-hydroxychromene-2-carboxylate isomerase
MGKIVTYYMTVVSPWTYFGHERLVALCARHGATIEMKPVDLGRIFPVSGGLPLKQRAPQRQAYRLIELARWKTFLGMSFNAQPKFAASGPDLAVRWTLAAREHDARAALDFAGAVMRARWAEERDIADPATLASCAAGAGLSVEAIAGRAEAPEMAALYAAETQEAIDAQVFGTPWYVLDGEPFWGQDRLDFLARKLAQ